MTSATECSRGLHRRVTAPTNMSIGEKYKQSIDCHSDSSSDNLIHHENTGHRYVFKNHNKIYTVYNATTISWQGIHNVITTEKNRELLDTE